MNECCCLIFSGLSQATALLSFVSQIGSEFEANLPFSHQETRLTTFYRYKYGYSFYLFLLSFALSELGAFFDMLAFFKKYPPAHYVISFRQDPLPPGPQSPASSPSPRGRSGGEVVNPYPTTTNRHQHQLPTLPNFNPHSDYGDSSTLRKGQQGSSLYPAQACPDLCNSFGGVGSGGWDGSEGERRVEEIQAPIPPPQSYMNTQVTITTIDRSTVIPPYATLSTRTTRNSHPHPNIPNLLPMESFGTLRKENNV